MSLASSSTVFGAVRALARSSLGGVGLLGLHGAHGPCTTNGARWVASSSLPGASSQPPPPPADPFHAKMQSKTESELMELIARNRDAQAQAVSASSADSAAAHGEDGEEENDDVLVRPANECVHAFVCACTHECVCVRCWPHGKRCLGNERMRVWRALASMHTQRPLTRCPLPPRRAKIVNQETGESMGPRGKEPTRYGEWSGFECCLIHTPRASAPTASPDTQAGSPALAREVDA
jgi:hypothetical protein